MRLLLAALLALWALPAAAGARAARCVVASAGQRPYDGPCRFTAGGKGSFAVEPGGRRSFAGGVTAISVSVTAPGVAEVRGLTRDGINSRWGEARRSRRDPACWRGSDFSLCVY